MLAAAGLAARAPPTAAAAPGAATLRREPELGPPTRYAIETTPEARDGAARRLAVARAAYWLLLAVLLAFLPVLQSWEALPWGSGWTAAKLVILLAVAILPIATRRRPRVHAAVVMALLAAGALFLLFNLGVLEA